MGFPLIFVSTAFLTVLVFSHPVFVFAAGKASYDGQAPEDIIVDYCIAHADRVAAGQNVVQDLVNAGLVSSYYSGKTCAEVKQLQENAYSDRCHGTAAFLGQRLDPDC
jgi:hypothetical protein